MEAVTLFHLIKTGHPLSITHSCTWDSIVINISWESVAL